MVLVQPCQGGRPSFLVHHRRAHQRLSSERASRDPDHHRLPPPLPPSPSPSPQAFVVLSGSGPERSASEQVEICGGYLAQSPEVQGLLVLAPSSHVPHPFHSRCDAHSIPHRDTRELLQRAAASRCMAVPSFSPRRVHLAPGSQLPARSTGHFLSAFSPPRCVLDSARCLSSGMGAARYVTGRADLVRLRGLPHVSQLACRRMILRRPPVPHPPQLPGVQFAPVQDGLIGFPPVQRPVLFCPVLGQDLTRKVAPFLLLFTRLTSTSILRALGLFDLHHLA